MKLITEHTENIDNGSLKPIFSKFYGEDASIRQVQQKRYLKLIDFFNDKFPKQESADFFITPGRTEVGGNHTDHNAGRVLAAAVDLDIIGLAAPNKRNKIRVHSEGFPACEIDLNDLSLHEDEKQTSAALIRGVCARASQLGFKTGGFDACFSSTVPDGAGLSSSAAYEVQICTILSHYYNQNRINPITNAQISQFAENDYFDKPCGLMDQTTCAFGGFVTIDFKDFDKPIVKKVDFSFADSGFVLIIVNTGGSHSDLTDEYTALENEMRNVARLFGYEVLRSVPEDVFLKAIPDIRRKIHDRAILRALHFHADDQRVVDQVKALEENRFQEFLRLIIESGESSWMLCQNCYSANNIEKQGLSIALAVSGRLLAEKGAWRVHGGGFAGTIQAFVPVEMENEYIEEMTTIFGPESCHRVMIRQEGSIRLDI